MRRQRSTGGAVGGESRLHGFKPRRWLHLALVLILLALAAPAASDNSTTQRSTQQVISTSGTDCSVAAACVVLPDIFRTGRYGSIDISGTFTGTAQFEGSVDGITWRALTVTPLAGGSAVTSATSAGGWTYAAAMGGLRVRASALSSGTMIVSLTAG